MNVTSFNVFEGCIGSMDHTCNLQSHAMQGQTDTIGFAVYRHGRHSLDAAEHTPTPSTVGTGLKQYLDRATIDQPFLWLCLPS